MTSIGSPSTPGLAERILGLSHALLERTVAADVLVSATSLAVENVEGCRHAGTSMVDGQAIRAAAATSNAARRLDEGQSEFGEGPCLDAIATRALVYTPDIAQEHRWPRLRPLAVAAGLGTVLSAPLIFDDQVVGAMNLYGEQAGALEGADRQFVLLFAFEAALAFALARAKEQAAEHAAQLQQALLSRDVIGQAKGILMERQRITADEAFDVLRKASQHLNVKLRNLAEHVVETGEIPGAKRA